MSEPREFDLLQQAAPIRGFDVSGTASCRMADPAAPRPHDRSENVEYARLVDLGPKNRDEKPPRASNSVAQTDVFALSIVVPLAP